MASLVPDVVFACRSFRKSPVFTVVAILSLALGIGANTAIFTLVDQLILRLLPVRDPQQIVLLAGVKVVARCEQAAVRGANSQQRKIITRDQFA